MSFTSAVASSRLEAANELSTSSTSPALGPIALSLTLARRDWSPSVRAAALASLATLSPTALPPPLAATLLLTLIDDPSPSVRATAYAAAAPSASLENILPALTLETDSTVRAAAFAALARASPAPPKKILLAALTRSDGTSCSQDELLARGEFSAVVADGVEDPHEGVRCAALALVAALVAAEGYSGGTEVARVAQALAVDALKGGKGRDVRVGVLEALDAVGGLVEVDLKTARALGKVMEMREERDMDALRVVARILGKRSFGDAAGFCVALQALEERIVAVRREVIENEGKSVDAAADAAEEVVLMVETKRKLVRLNLSWAHVADLRRHDYDRLVPCWSK